MLFSPTIRYIPTPFYHNAFLREFKELIVKDPLVGGFRLACLSFNSATTFGGTFSFAYITDTATIMKVILIPGMGCTPVIRSNWYAWFAKEMNKRDNVECDLQNFPDPYKCRESIWLPHVEKLVEDPENTVIVGHSSGAACAMRLLEKATEKPFAACILVAAAYTDLGDEDERLSEYFNRPWDWNRMAQGASKIVLFHGTDDHLIPVKEARHIAQQLSSVSHFEFLEMAGKSHFFEPWSEILDVMDAIVK